MYNSRNLNWKFRLIYKNFTYLSEYQPNNICNKHKTLIKFGKILENYFGVFQMKFTVN